MKKSTNPFDLEFILFYGKDISSYNNLFFAKKCLQKKPRRIVNNGSILTNLTSLESALNARATRQKNN